MAGIFGFQDAATTLPWRLAKHQQCKRKQPSYAISSSSRFASIKSAVLKPSVNHA